MFLSRWGCIHGGCAGGNKGLSLTLALGGAGCRLMLSALLRGVPWCGSPSRFRFRSQLFALRFLRALMVSDFFVAVVCRLFVCRKRVDFKRTVSELRTLDYTNLSQIYHRNSPVFGTFEIVRMKNRETRSSSLKLSEQATIRAQSINFVEMCTTFAV